MFTIVTVNGNPKVGSKTQGIADALVDGLTAHLQDVASDVVRIPVELGALGPRLLQWQDPEVAERIETVRRANLLVVATPTYKATYTGLLKTFLDQFPPGGLANVLTIPLMVGAAPHHALAVEVHLRPLLVELGACCPWRGLYVLESVWDQGAFHPAEWLQSAAPVLSVLARTFSAQD